jgi:hypothetical protein
LEFYLGYGKDNFVENFQVRRKRHVMVVDVCFSNEEDDSIYRKVRLRG